MRTEGLITETWDYDWEDAFDGTYSCSREEAGLIEPDGLVQCLDLSGSATLLVRDYNGVPPVPITVQTATNMGTTGILRVDFGKDDWGSTISFASGITVTRGGTLNLTFESGVDVTKQLGWIGISDGRGSWQTHCGTG